MIGEQVDIARSFAQRRHMHVDDVEAEQEVFPEGAATHLLIEIPVRGGKQADIDLDGMASADAVDLALLEHAQQFRLQPWVHFADLVE